MPREVDLGSIVGPQGPAGKDGTVDNIKVTDTKNILGGGNTVTYTLQKYLDAVSDKVIKHNKVTEVSFPASGWTASGTSFTQTISVSGDTALAAFVDDGTTATISNNKKKAYSCVTEFVTLNGSIKATCKYKKPSTDFKVAFKGV